MTLEKIFEIYEQKRAAKDFQKVFSNVLTGLPIGVLK